VVFLKIKNMKKVISTLILASLYAFSFGQIARPEVTPAGSPDVDITQQPVKKVQYSLNAGTSFSFGTFKSSSYYIAPQLTYQLTPKFRLNTSLIFINSNITAPGNATLNLGQNQACLFEQKTNETIVYASGDYQLNDKILITGSVIKNFNSPTSSKMEQAGWRNSFQMMSMGLQYKITPNITLGAQFKVVQGDNLYNPLYYNMYSYGSPNPWF
jgi:predicted porin